MANTYQNTNCKLYGSHYCFALNAKSCMDCGVTDENVNSTKEWIDEIDALLPENGVAPFFTGDKCLLCKGENKNQATYYAMTNIGNQKPGCTTRNVDGEVVRTVLGAILPLQLSCCDKCRKNYNAVGNSHIPKTVMIAVIMIALLNVTSVFEAVASVAMWLPMVLYVAVVSASWFLANHIRNVRMKKNSLVTHLHLMDIPEMQPLKENGWIELSPYKDLSRFVFDKELVQKGLYTAAPKTTIEENL